MSISPAYTITPVLKGSCRIQGPVEEVDLDVETNLAVLPTEKGFGQHCLTDDVPMKASGTCNVCAAPCSSCMHFNRAVSFMESKAEGGNSENSCGRKETDNCSFSNSEMPPFYKSKPCDDRMQVASETSKMFSTTSSHDSYSENAESKGTVKTPDVHDASEGVDMPLKLTSFETVEENQLPVEHNINSQSSQEPTNPKVVQRTFSNHLGDPHGLECHGDNISCVTGLRDVNVAASDLRTNLGGKNMPCTSGSASALHGQGFKMAAQAQAADGDIVDTQGTLQRSGKFAKEPLQAKGSSSELLNVGFSLNHSESPSLDGKPTPKEQCLHSNSKIGNSVCTNVGAKDAEENSSSQLRLQPSESFMEAVETSLEWQMTMSGMDEQKSNRVSHATIHSNYENSKACNITIDASSPCGTYECFETKTGGDDGNPTDDSTKHGIPNEQHEKPSSSLDTFNAQGPQPESLPTLEGDCPDPDTLEDDVKVCDICGDAGREDLLAICSRCSDGAEHIYCMRIMLDKVPEGDWFCEECKLKDVVTDKMEKSDTVFGALKAPCSNEKVQKVGSSFNPKLLPRLDISTTDAEAPLAVKGLQSPQMSAKRPSGNADITSLSNKKHSDTSGASVLTASPSKKSMLSRESSFKNLDAGKAKQGSFAPPSGSQSSNSSQVFSRPLTPGPNLSRIQEQLQCPRGSLSRSGSFNGLKPKVKQVIENVPQKPQVTKEYAASAIKEVFVRTLGKSASCKNINSGHSNVFESTTKSQSVSLHRPEESRNLQQSKERIIERRNSFVLNRTSTSSSPASAPSVSLPKAESKTLQNDGKANSLPEPNVSHPNKGSEDTHDKGVKELRKQASHASKAFGSHPSNGPCSFADQRPTQVAPREDAHVGSSGDINTVPQHILSHSSNHDEKFKDSSSFGSSRSLVSPSKRILRCQRCNETGHSTQFCSIDKLRVSALKPSAERSSREAANKGNKWKDAVDAAISKGRMQKNLPDQSEEISSTDISSEIVSQNHSSSSSSCVKDLPTVDGTADKQSSLRNSTADISKTTVNDVKQHAPQMMGTVCTSRDGESNAFSTHREGLKAKPSLQILPEHHPVHFDPLKVSALPDHEYIWQGSFEVKRSGRLPELCDGIQAHLSTCASPKVLKVVPKFPDKVQLEEVACLSSWPLQFQENSPTEENIALFFFAKDVASYEKSYSKLLENMLKNDLALKGSFDGIELIIFPSSKLPEKSQRWNQLLFLWGVFRERRSNCSETSSGPWSKTRRSNYHSEHVVHDLPMQLVTKVAVSEKESPHEDMNKDISRLDQSINTETDDLKILSFLGAESGLSYMDKPFCQRTTIQGAIDQGAIDSKLHLDRNTSNSIAATDLLTSKSEQTGSHYFPEPRIQKSTAQLCLEGKSSSNSTCQKGFLMGSDGRKDDELPLFQNSSTQTVHSHATDGLSAMHMITSNPGPPDLNVNSQDMKDVSSEPTVKHQLSSLPVRGAGVVGSKDEEKMKGTSRSEKGNASDSAITVDKTETIGWLSGLPNMKRPRSHSPENISQSSGGTSVGTSAEMMQRNRTECISLDKERESKKMKVHSEAPACSRSGVDTFGDKGSSKVHPLLANFLNEQLHPDKVHSLPTLPESSWNSERHFFPLDSSSVMDTKTGSLIPLQILSSDDEYEHQQEFDAPNLELALGAKKRPMKQEIQPLSFPLVGKNKQQGKLPDPATEEGDDESASLSLSLAFPFSGKEQVQMPVPKTEQLLPKRPQVKMPFFLFGGFADS